jgi:hypothetical protein
VVVNLLGEPAAAIFRMIQKFSATYKIGQYCNPRDHNLNHIAYGLKAVLILPKHQATRH